MTARLLMTRFLKVNIPFAREKCIKLLIVTAIWLVFVIYLLLVINNLRSMMSSK